MKRWDGTGGVALRNGEFPRVLAAEAFEFGEEEQAVMAQTARAARIARCRSGRNQSPPSIFASKIQVCDRRHVLRFLARTRPGYLFAPTRSAGTNHTSSTIARIDPE